MNDADPQYMQTVLIYIFTSHVNNNMLLNSKVK